MRGGKRGQPSQWAADAFDVRIAMSELRVAHEQLIALESVTDTSRRRELHRAAVAKVALAARACDDVVLRRGGTLP